MRQNDDVCQKRVTQSTFRLQRPGMALGLLGCLFLFCFIVAGVILPFIPRFIERPEAAIRITAVIQDILIFIIPAVGMAVVVTRLPARLLCINRIKDYRYPIMAVLTLLVSIPAMNAVVAWNESWHLPESMGSVEAYFRGLEEGAKATVDILMSGASIPSLIVSVLIVGFLAGFSEELFFRGALQRCLSLGRMNPHMAIWLTAFIFSALHFQFFGFVPRMLLGAFFGYLLWWSGTLWVPVICHILNNTLVVISEYCSAGNSGDSISEIGSTFDTPVEVCAVIISLVLVGLGLFMLARRRPHRLRPQ